MKSSVELSQCKTSIEYKVGYRRFVDASWGKERPEVEAQLFSLLDANSTVGQLIINLTTVTWIGPIPLMSLLLLAAHLEDLYGVTVVYRYPKEEHVSEHGEVLTNRAYKFIINNAFDKYMPTSEGRGTVSLFKTDHYAYIPIDVFEVNSLEFVYNYTDECVTKVECLMSGTKPLLKDYTLYRLRNVLIELLSNVYFHAYSQGGAQPKRVALFIRNKIGLARELRAPDYIKKLIEDEERECPQLVHDDLKTTNGCLELFLMDYGCGIISGFNGKAGTIASAKDVSELINQIFYDGKRGAASSADTVRGGLSSLRKLLIPYNDYIRFCSDNWWVGATASRNRYSDKDRELATNFDVVETNPRGVFYHLKLKQPDMVDNTKPQVDEFCSWYLGEAIRPDDILNIYRETPEDLSAVLSDNLTKIDLGDYITYATKLDEVRSWVKAYDLNVLYVSAPNKYTKNDIVTCVKNLFERLREIKHSLDSLVLYDISEHESGTFSEAIDSLSYEHYICSKIILVTKNYNVSVYDLNDEEFIQTAPNDILHAKVGRFGLLSIVRQIRVFDSIEVWDHIRKTEMVCYPYSVDWNPDTLTGDAIDGYLDFALSISDAEIAKVYNKTSTRIISVVEQLGSQVVCIDEYSKDFIWRTLTAGSPNVFLEKDKKFYIGTVFVTGRTLEKASFKYNDQAEHNIHFFCHPNSDSHVSALLLWLPEGGEGDVLDYQRLGATPIAAPGGWKSIRMHRYYPVPDEDGKYVSMYYRTPKETYEDIQKSIPAILKIGHWEYGKHHDLWHINIHSALLYSYSSSRGIGLLDYLKYGFLKAAYGDKLSGYSELDRQHEEFADFFQYLPKCDVICYISHPTTESSVDIIQSAIAREVSKLNFTKEIKLVPLVMLRGQSTVANNAFHPMCGVMLSQLKGRNVLFFDDGLVSGAARESALTFLYSFGFINSYTLTVVDRRRLTGVQGYRERLYSYWRLDLPTCGDRKSCRVCGLIENTKSYMRGLSKKEQVEVQKWLDEWQVYDPNLSWYSPSGYNDQIQLRNEGRKRFGILPDGKGGYFQPNDEHIRILSTTGLLLHTIELQAMTGNNSRYLKLFREEERLHIVHKMMLLNSLVLLFPTDFKYIQRQHIVYNLIELLFMSDEDGSQSYLSCMNIMMHEKSLVQDALARFLNSGSVCINKDKYPGCLQALFSLFLNAGYCEFNISQSVLDIAGKKYDLSAEAYSGMNALMVKANRGLLPPPEKMGVNYIYQHLYYELFSVSHKIHSRPLAKLAKHEYSPDVRDDAINSCERVINFINNIPIYSYPRKFTKDDRSLMTEHARSTKKKLLELTKDDSNIEDVVKACDEASHFVSLFKDKFISNFFLFYKAKDHRLFKQELMDLNTHTDEEGESLEVECYYIPTDLSSEYQHIIPWDNGIKTAISDIFTNVRHANGEKVKRPRECTHIPSSKQVDMLCCYSFVEEGVKVCFCNSSSSDGKRLLKNVSSGYIDEVNGKVYGDNTNGCYKVDLLIPHIKYLTEDTRNA